MDVTDLLPIKSPMVGTFYAAPAPDADYGKFIPGAQLFGNFGRDPCYCKVHFSGRHKELSLDFFHPYIAGKIAVVKTAAIISHGKMRCKGLVATYTDLGCWIKKQK